MARILLLALTTLLLAANPAAAQNSFRIEQVADGVYAAIARPASQATSNAFFVVGQSFVVAGGAHLTRTGAADLQAAIATVTDLPLRYYILPHHHRGYTAVDFDMPAGCEAVMSVETWQALSSEVRKVDFPVLFYSQGLTLKPGPDQTIVLSDLGAGHAEGDTLVYLPESKVLFTSDLVYVHNVGYLGDGHMSNWVMALEFMTTLDVKKVIPGYGPVSPAAAIVRYRDFLKAFLSEILRHIERGDSLEKTRRTFTLKDYRDWGGYQQFLATNLDRAYRDLKENVVDSER